MIKSAILLLFCIVAVFRLSGQESGRHAVSLIEFVGTLHSESKYITIMEPQITNTSININKIPCITDNYRIYELVFRNDQKKYNDMLNKKITKDEFNTYIDEKNINTALLTANLNLKNSIYIYVGVDSLLDKKYIVIDKNNNLDLTDDTVYNYTLSDRNNRMVSKKKLAIYTSVPMEYYDGVNIYPALAHLVIHPLGDERIHYDDKTEEERQFRFVVFKNAYWQGSFVIDGQYVNVWNTNSDLINISLIEKSIFYFQADNDPKWKITAKRGDTIAIAGRLLQLSDYKINTLYIDDLGSHSDSSQIGKFLPELFSMSLDDGNSMIQLNNLFRNKYVFIDFWGSWCAPCVASLLKIREFYETVRHRTDVEIIGIALDDERDLKKLKSIIAQNNVEWPNYWNNYKTTKQFTFPHAKLHINEYPTYMIVDKAGKIVHRSSSSIASIDFFYKIINRKE